MKNTNIFIVFKLNGTWKFFWRCGAYVCGIIFLFFFSGFFHFLLVYVWSWRDVKSVRGMEIWCPFVNCLYRTVAAFYIIHLCMRVCGRVFKNVGYTLHDV